MDGFGFLEALRGQQEHHDISIVVLTAKDLSEQERERLALDVRAILRKSMHSREDLVAELRRVLRTETAEAARG
jgi:CheY-like chemotaxis protein